MGLRSGSIISSLPCGISRVLSFFSGWSFFLCAFIMMGVVLLYLLLGGFKAVVRTDFLQYLAIVFIMVLLIFVLFGDVSIPTSEWNFSDAGFSNVFGFF